MDIKEIIEEHGAALRRYCYRRVGADAAEDIWVETLLSAMKTPMPADNPNTRAWLFKIAKNKATDLIRRESVRRRAEEQLRFTSEITEIVLDESHEQTLAKLSERQRSILLWRTLSDLGYRDLAALLGDTELVLRRSLCDGIGRLRHLARQEGNNS